MFSNKAQQYAKIAQESSIKAQDLSSKQNEAYKKYNDFASKTNTLLTVAQGAENHYKVATTNYDAIVANFKNEHAWYINKAELERNAYNEYQGTVDTLVKEAEYLQTAYETRFKNFEKYVDGYNNESLSIPERNRYAELATTESKYLQVIMS